MHKVPIVWSMTALVIGGSTACATKKFVRTNVGDVNEKVESLGKSVEQTQERTRQNDTRITQVDQRAQTAQQSAQRAQQAATEASTLAKNADAKAESIESASRRLVNEVVVSEEQDHFKFGQAELPDAAKARLDEMVTHLKQDPKNVFIEIEGYTDSVGSETVNQKVGLERAEAVERYLHERYQVPLHRMNVISYGEDRPVAPNETKAGRAQNRRVVVKVLA